MSAMLQAFYVHKDCEVVNGSRQCKNKEQRFNAWQNINLTQDRDLGDYSTMDEALEAIRKVGCRLGKQEK